MYSRLTLFITLLSSALTLALPNQAFAQGVTAIDIGVSPPTTYYHIEPGQKKTLGITIEQKGTLPVEITPSLVDFASDGKTGQPVLSDKSDFRFLSLSLPRNETGTSDGKSFILSPGQKKNVSVTLDIPSEAAEGEFPLTLLFRAKPDLSNSLGNPGSEVSAVVGSNLIVLISSSDRDRSNLTLEEIKTYKVVDSFMPISFTLTAKNSGHNASTASGSAQIVNWQGNTIADFPIYPDMVLAQSSRDLRTTDDLEAALENPSLIANDFRFKPIFAIGPYTITATLEKNVDGVDQSNTVTQTIFALPFSIILIILILIAVWAIFSYMSTKSESGLDFENK